MEETKRLLEVRDEAECLKLLIDFFKDARERYKPALDHFLDDGIEKAAKTFLFEEAARHRLDEAARAEGKGYLHAADKIMKEEIARREAEAEARAVEAAKLAAENAEKEAAAKKAAEDARALQLKRDEEDAVLAANVKAAKLAQQMGQAAVNV